MGQVLVTGAAGNVGREVVSHLLAKGASVKAAVFSAKQGVLPGGVGRVRFDFADPSTYPDALDGVDRLFLLRPPQIADVQRCLFPLIDDALAQGVRQIAFLSLQGAEFNLFTPHHKVEKYLRARKAPFTFLRPNFYMQNLSTFYQEDIRDRSEIFLPAGKGRTAFIDVRDIGAVAARVLTEEGHIGKAYTLSGPESLDYFQVAQTLSAALGREIRYADPSVGEYVDRLRQQKTAEDFIKVQKMLYFVVRHNFSASTRSDTEALLGRALISLKEFVEDFRRAWL